MKEILKDNLKPRLAVVFCGTAVGNRSATRRAYYAGVGNAFWRTLREIGLTPKRFEPEQYRTVSSLGLGFTDLAKRISGNDAVLRQEHVDGGALRRKILKFKPNIVAFTSKRAAAEFLGKPVEYGLLDESIGPSRLFVLPSPSGAARRWWRIDVWHDLAKLVRERRTSRSTRSRAKTPAPG